MNKITDLTIDNYDCRITTDGSGKLTKLEIKTLDAPVNEFQEVPNSYVGKVLKVSDLEDVMKEAKTIGNVIHKDNWYSKVFSTESVKVEYDDPSFIKNLLPNNPYLKDEYEPILKACKKYNLDTFVNDENAVSSKGGNEYDIYNKIAHYLLDNSTEIDQLYKSEGKYYLHSASLRELNGIKFVFQQDYEMGSNIDTVYFNHKDGISLGFIKA